jgi:hypothetical protein
VLVTDLGISHLVDLTAGEAPPAATEGDGWTGADDRVASCDDDPSCGRAYVRRRDGMPLARFARRNIVVVGRRASFDIHVGPWGVRGVDHVLRHGDLGHAAGADGIGMENKRPAESLPGSDCGNGARDCGRGRGRGRVTAAVGVAGIPALELGADAAGGPRAGNGGEARCRRMPPGRVRRGGRVGRDGAGGQPAAGRRYGHGRAGQRSPETWHRWSPVLGQSPGAVPGNPGMPAR